MKWLCAGCGNDIPETAAKNTCTDCESTPRCAWCLTGVDDEKICWPKCQKEKKDAKTMED